MTKNPFYNAILASGYVTGVVGLITLGSHFAEQVPEDNFLMPVGMISLLVLSVAVMAYIFFYQPVLMLLDGKRTDAAHLFLKTVAIFAGITLLVLIASFALFL